MSFWLLASVLAAVCLSQLNLDQLTESFFACSGTEQMALLGLLFCVLFGVASASASAAAATPTKKLSPAPVYPVEAIQNAKTDKEAFLSVYPMLREEILEHLKAENELSTEAAQWMEKMLDYNVPGGKLNRGTTVIDVCRTLKKRDLTPIELARAAVLGWSIEFLQAFFLVADDVMDESQTRRGQPCWYKRPEVHWIAINDAFLLESFVFTLLKKHFGHEDYYIKLIELLLNITQKTEIGQLLDLTSQPINNSGPMDLERFTLQRYTQIVKYKTAFYSFYLPVALGMISCGKDSPDELGLAKEICCLMGEYFQVQDDYLDCFGDPSVIGKVGTDIQDNKCSWLVVQALDRATPEQREVLKENYGVWNDDKVATVKRLYRDLQLPKVFEKYEEDSYSQIQERLQRVTLIPKAVFEIFLNKIYKRSK